MNTFHKTLLVIIVIGCVVLVTSPLWLPRLDAYNLHRIAIEKNNPVLLLVPIPRAIAAGKQLEGEDFLVGFLHFKTPWAPVTARKTTLGGVGLVFDSNAHSLIALKTSSLLDTGRTLYGTSTLETMYSREAIRSPYAFARAELSATPAHDQWLLHPQQSLALSNLLFAKAAETAVLHPTRIYSFETPVVIGFEFVLADETQTALWIFDRVHKTQYAMYLASSTQAETDAIVSSIRTN